MRANSVCIYGDRKSLLKGLEFTSVDVRIAVVPPIVEDSEAVEKESQKKDKFVKSDGDAPDFYELCISFER